MPVRPSLSKHGLSFAVGIGIGILLGYPALQQSLPNAQLVIRSSIGRVLLAGVLAIAVFMLGSFALYQIFVLYE